MERKNIENKYSYGKYQDKNLSKNKEMNISPQPNFGKKASPKLGIGEYLKGLREGVGL